MKKTIIIALTLILILASFISCENNTHEHTWDKGTVTKAATCTEKGVTTYTCTVCKETKTEDIAIDPENHTWDEGEVTTAATCTEAGLKTFTCTGCTATKSEALEALGHSWDEGNVKKATYLEKGTKTITCNRCNIVIEEEIPVIPINGSSFIVIDGYTTDELNCVGFEFDKTKYYSYDGIGTVTTPDVFELSLKFKGSDSYELDLDSKEIKLYQPKSYIVFDINEEKNLTTGDVEYVSISSKDKSITMDLIPITINKTLVAKAEGHYYKANCDFKTSISEKSSETTIEIKSITYDLYNHIGDYTIDDGITVGYFTPGLVDWDKCTVCGYEGKGPNAIPLTGTTWLSTGPVNAYGISNKFLQIEFSDNTLANISVKDSKDSEAKVIESDCRYDVQFDYVAGTATINIYGLNAPNYGGPATENLKNGQIEINNKAFNDGKLTFEKIIED